MTGLGVLDPDLYEHGDPWTAGLPLDMFARLRNETPCFWQSLKDDPAFIDGAWIVSRYADIVTMLRDTKRFSSKQGTSVRKFDPTVPDRGGKRTMVSMDGGEHQRNRTVTSRMFTPRAVEAFANSFRQIAVDLVESALDRGEIDLIADLACLMPLRAISEMIGIPESERQQVLTWTNRITVPLDPHMTPSQKDFDEALHGLWSYGLKLAAHRRDEPDDSVMTAVAAGHADGRLGPDEVQGYMLQLAAAGNETTRNAIAFGLHALLLRPEQMAMLRAQNGHVPDSVIEEILRWASPTILTVRMPVDDYELHGQRIPAGDPMVMLLSSANFDPAQFDRPDQFEIMRQPNEHVAFGVGPHQCLGIHVARLELRILFEEFMRRAGHIELDGEIEFIRDNLIHGIRKMPIRISRKAKH